MTKHEIEDVYKCEEVEKLNEQNERDKCRFQVNALCTSGKSGATCVAATSTKFET